MQLVIKGLINTKSNALLSCRKSFNLVADLE